MSKAPPGIGYRLNVEFFALCLAATTALGALATAAFAPWTPPPRHGTTEIHGSARDAEALRQSALVEQSDPMTGTTDALMIQVALHEYERLADCLAMGR